MYTREAPIIQSMQILSIKLHLEQFAVINRTGTLRWRCWLQICVHQKPSVSIVCNPSLTHEWSTPHLWQWLNSRKVLLATWLPHIAGILLLVGRGVPVIEALLLSLPHLLNIQLISIEYFMLRLLLLSSSPGPGPVRSGFANLSAQVRG